ncbi:MAG TPA: aspartate/glutamate racemase family protein [Pseudogracilibacillus sp.]|nr:aspartate/glutamate racemase family protein [Pseudogracilibacillus sp.]
MNNNLDNQVVEHPGGHPFYGYRLGILMLDMKAPLLPGNVGNAMSYDFPVRYKVLEDVPSSWFCDTQGPDKARCEVVIKAAKELEAEGCKAITAGCGFFSVYQKEVAEAVNIPVFLSPLIMVPMLSRMLGTSSRIGIVTADSSSLKGSYLDSVGIDESIKTAVAGLEDTKEFYNVHVTCDKKSVNPQAMEKEVVEASVKLVEENPDIKLLVFECSDIPPFARAASRATGLPVFDYITLARMVGQSIIPIEYPEFFG